MKWFGRLLIIILISCLPSCAAAAGALNSPITARFENFYLDDALVMLTESTDLSLVMCGQLNRGITMKIDNIALSQGLVQLAKENNVKLLLKSNVVVVRTSARPSANAVVSCSLTKLPLTDALKAVGEAYGLEVAVRGQLKGEVNDELKGTMKEVLDALAAKYGFAWSASRSTVRITGIGTK